MNHSTDDSGKNMTGAPGEKKPGARITKNFFLHIHASYVHPHSLKPSYTFGLGIILGFLFLIMIFTGVLLMMNYTPSVEEAYNTILDIIHIVPGGRIIRNLHRLASHAMVMMVFLHLLRIFYTGSYLGGRRLNWIIGLCMFILVLMMSFSGYLLPWDQLSYWAVTIGSNIAASAREITDLLGITGALDIGGFFKRMLIGGEQVGQPALTRFFMLHVVFFPITMLVLIGVHLWRIRKDGGISRPVDPGSGHEKKLPAWPVVMWTELAILLGLISILLLGSFFIEAPLLEKANPTHPENPAKSPWYFLGIQEMVSYSAFAGGLIVPGLFLYFLFSLPYRDTEDRHTGIWFSGRQGRRISLYSGLLAMGAVLLQLIIIAKFGWLRDWFPALSQWFVMLFNPATITLSISILIAYIVKYRTRSTRMSALALFTAAAVALIIFTIIGIWFRGENWQFIIPG